MLNKKIIKSLGLMLVCILVLTSCGQKKTETPAEVSKPEVSKSEVSTSENSITFSAFDLESDEVVKNEMLKKDINFVSVWQIPCPPCETEMKAISSIKEKHPDVEFIGLCADEKSEDIKKTMEEWGINFTNYKIDPAFLEEKKDTLKGTPSMYVVDKNGNELLPLQEGLVSSGATVEDVATHIESLIEQVKNEK